MSDIGILLTNIGTPEQPTAKAVRRYLKEFLSDQRVVSLPRVIWWPILYGIILPFRSRSSAKLYQTIWREDGSPLLTGMQTLTEQLQKKLSEAEVVFGMHYGRPTIKNALDTLRKKNVKKIFILPLFPQYSNTTTATTFDQVTDVLKTWHVIPEIQMINHYADQVAYIDAVASSIQKMQKTSEKPHQNHLLFSFHGIPKLYVERGDPYPEQCYRTAKLVAEKLQLKKADWSISFQSRLGRAEWLTPYTDHLLQELPKRGVKNLQVVCPGFAIDCLETLEEIAIRGREQFLRAGGERFEYISALNSDEKQVDMLIKLISLLPLRFL